MRYSVEFSEDAKKDRAALDGSVQKQVNNAIYSIAKNPLPRSEGGYGTSLGHKRGRDLTGLCRIKLLKLGIQVVYKVIRDEKAMKIIVIAARSDEEVYEIAAVRAKKD